MGELVVLVADRNAEYVVRGALARPSAIGIRPVEYEVISHAHHDSGVRVTGAQLLALHRRHFSHGLMLLDYEGSGASVNPEDLERQLDGVLADRWGTNGKAIVISPEIDAWVWGSETHLREVVDWQFDDGIRSWLRSRGYEFTGTDKPLRPKEAFEEVCRRSGMPRSSGLYRHMATRVSLQRCEDAAYGRLRATLLDWFPIGSGMDGAAPQDGVAS